MDGDTIGPTRSSIGATIPSALELRDNRSHSEGNLLLIGPDNIEDNQATIVSLPPTMMTDYTESKCEHGIVFFSKFFYFSYLGVQFLSLINTNYFSPLEVC